MIDLKVLLQLATKQTADRRSRTASIFITRFKVIWKEMVLLPMVLLDRNVTTVLVYHIDKVICVEVT